MNELQVISAAGRVIGPVGRLCVSHRVFRHFGLFSVTAADAEPIPITAGSQPAFRCPDLCLFCHHLSAEWQPGNVVQTPEAHLAPDMCWHRDLRTAGCRA